MWERKLWQEDNITGDQEIYTCVKKKHDTSHDNDFEVLVYLTEVYCTNLLMMESHAVFCNTRHRTDFNIFLNVALFQTGEHVASDFD